MHRLATTKRRDSKGNIEYSALNAAHVRYVVSRGSGSYIAFDDEHDPRTKGVTPIGVDSPDPAKLVIERLNRPYWIDFGFRVGGLFLSAIAIILAVVFSK